MIHSNPQLLHVLEHEKRMKEAMRERVLLEKATMEIQEGRIRCDLQALENRIYELVKPDGSLI